MKKITFLMVDKKTGHPFYLSMPLKGTKKYSHLIAAVRKANKGSKLVDYRIDD